MANKSEFEVVLEDSVTPSARKAGSSLQRLQKQFEKFNKSTAGKVIGKLGGWAKDVIAIGAATAAAVGAAVVGMTVSMIDFSQRSTLAFKQLAKTGEVPEKIFQRTIDLAKQFGLDIQATTDAMIKFRSVGFSQKQSEQLIKMGADMRALGADSEQVGRAFLAISQIQSATRLQGDELNQLAEAGIPVSRVYEELSRQLGKTIPQVIKLKEAGGVSSKMAITAIKSAMKNMLHEGDLGQVGLQVANQTLGGMAGRLKAGFQDMFRRVGQQSEGAISGALGPIADKLMALFDDPKTANAISSVVVAISNAIQQALPYVEMFLNAFGAGFKETMPAIIEGFRTVIGMFSDFGGGSANLKNIIVSVGKACGTLAAILAGAFVAAVGIAAGVAVYISGVIEYWRTLLDYAAKAWGNLIFAIVDAFANISAIFNAEGMSIGEKALALGKAIVMGIVNGIKALANMPVMAIKGIAQATINAGKTMLGIHSPSTVFAHLGEMMGAGMAYGIDVSTPKVQGATRDMGDAAVSGVSFPTSRAANMNAVFNISVPLSGSATYADGQRLASGMRDRLHDIVQDWMEDAALEAGV